MDVLKFFKSRLTYTAHAVRIHLELEVAKKELSRWKKTEASSHYQRCTLETRKRLQDEHEKAKLAAAQLEMLRVAALEALEQPLALPPDNIDAMGEELQQWKEQFKSFVSIDLPLGTEDPAEWSWEEVKVSVEVLDKLLEKLMTDQLEKHYVNPNSVEEESMPALDMEDGTGIEGKIQKLLRQGQNICGPTEDLYDLRGKLAQHVDRSHEELVRLRASLNEIEGAENKMRHKLDILAGWAEQDTSRINELAERLQHLAKLPNPTIKPPHKVADVIRAMVVKELDHIKQDLFEKMAIGMQGDMEKGRQQVSRELESIMELTRSVQQRASEITRGRNRGSLVQ